MLQKTQLIPCTLAVANASLLGVEQNNSVFLEAFPFKLFLVEAGFEICL
jgi:hypothetical protein